MRVAKVAVREEKAPDYVQRHRLTFDSKVLEFTIVTSREGISSASIKGLLGTDEPMPYPSIEAARAHWESLINQGWKHEQI